MDPRVVHKVGEDLAQRRLDSEAPCTVSADSTLSIMSLSVADLTDLGSAPHDVLGHALERADIVGREIAAPESAREDGDRAQRASP